MTHTGNLEILFDILCYTYYVIFQRWVPFSIQFSELTCRCSNSNRERKKTHCRQEYVWRNTHRVMFLALKMVCWMVFARKLWMIFRKNRHSSPMFYTPLLTPFPTPFPHPTPPHTTPTPPRVICGEVALYYLYRCLMGCDYNTIFVMKQWRARLCERAAFDKQGYEILFIKDVGSIL